MNTNPAIIENSENSENLYRALYHKNPSMYFTVNSDGIVVSVNQFGANRLGYTPVELIGQSVLKVVHPDDHPDAIKHIQECARGVGQLLCWEFRKVRKDGQTMWVKEVAHTIQGPEEALQILIVCEDVTELKRTEARLRMQQTVLEQIAVGVPVQDVLAQLCRWIEKLVPGSISAVLTLDREGKLNVEAGPSLSADLRAAFAGVVPGAGMGSCAAAVMDSKPVLVGDTETSEHWVHIREVARRFGIRACWSIPIFSNNRKVVGSFPICHGMPKEPDEFELRLLEAASHLAGIALQRDRDAKALRDSEQRVLDILDNSPAVVQMKDIQGRYLMVNKRIESLFAVRRSELIGKSLFEIHSEAVAQRLWANDQVVFAADRAIEFEEVVTVAGGERTYLSAKFPLRDTSGEVYAVCGISTDITDRKRTEQALREKNAQLSLLQVVAVAANEARSSDEALGRVLDEVCAHTGWPVGHVYRVEDGEAVMKPTGIWHVETPERFAMFRAITERTDFRVGEGLPGRVLASGKPAWIVDVWEDTNFPRARTAKDLGVRGAFGFPVLVGSEVAAVLEFFSERPEAPNEAMLEVMAQVGTQLGRVIERERSDSALRESKERFRRLVEHAADAFYVHDLEGRIVDVNRCACRQLGYSREELLSLSVWDIETSFSAETGRALWKEFVDTTDVPVRFESTLKRRDGKTIPVEVSLGSLVWSGRPMMLALARDITERRRAEQEKTTLQSQLHQAEKMKAIGTLASGVAHDFNNYLTAIYGCAELVKKELPGESAAVETLGMIERMSKQAMGLADSLMTFARQSTTEKSPVDLAELVVETVRLLRRLLPNTIQISHHVGEGEGGGVWVLGHRISLQQVLMNLALNARDAMPEGGELRVRLERVEDPQTMEGEAGLVVEDTGVGMTPEVMARVFEPFYTTKERGEGTGLGLSVVHGIVTDHRGEIDLESGVNRGTRFTVRLPVCDPPASRADGARSGEARGANELIVLAEENDYVREIMASTLESAGYTVVAVGDERLAVEEVRNHGTRARLFVVDRRLLERPGLSCGREVRRMEADLPVLVVGEGGACSEELLAGGGAAVLARPFQMSALLEAVGSLLEKPLTTGAQS